LELYRLVKEWERFAKATNSKLAKWVHASTPDERTEAAREVLFAGGPQAARAYDVARAAGFDTDLVDAPEYRDKLDLHDLIAIYAPDLEDQFRHVVTLRMEQLQFLQEVAIIHDPEVGLEGLQEAVRAWTDDARDSLLDVTEQDLRDFERSEKLLPELRREVASFVGTHWELRDVTL